MAVLWGVMLITHWKASKTAVKTSMRHHIWRFYDQLNITTVSMNATQLNQ